MKTGFKNKHSYTTMQENELGEMLHSFYGHQGSSEMYVMYALCNTCIVFNYYFIPHVVLHNIIVSFNYSNMCKDPLLFYVFV